jgi:hypothetical protein
MDGRITECPTPIPAAWFYGNKSVRIVTISSEIGIARQTGESPLQRKPDQHGFLLGIVYEARFFL